MHKINWERFKSNVKSFIEYRDQSWSEYSKQYVKKNKTDTWFCRPKSEVEAWGKVVLQLTDPERDVLLQLMDAVLGYKDSTFFFQSMEGDFCMAEVNLAGRLERGEGLNAGDCQSLAHYHEWINDNDDQVKVPELPATLSEKLLKFDNVPSIWSELLC